MAGMISLTTSSAALQDEGFEDEEASELKPIDDIEKCTTLEVIPELTADQLISYSIAARKRLKALAGSIKYIRQLQDEAGGSIDGIDFPCVKRGRRREEG